MYFVSFGISPNNCADGKGNDCEVVQILLKVLLPAPSIF